MKMNIHKIFRGLALTWLDTFDKNCFLYKSLKSLNFIYRYTFYTLLVLSLYFFMEISKGYINPSDYQLSLTVQEMLSLLGALIQFLAILFTIGIYSYEALYNMDIDSYLLEEERKNTYIKNNQLEKWRLKNMNLLFRIMLYIGGWFILYLIAEQILINSFIQVYTNPTKEIYVMFLYDYDLTIKILSLAYVFLILILDYLVRKNKRNSSVSCGNILNQKFPQETKKEK